MKEKLIVYGLAAVGVLGIFLLITPMFWYLAMPFYYRCQDVVPGMTINEAEQVMAPYMNNKRVVFFRGELTMSAKTALEGDGMGFYTKGLDMRCQITFEGNKIKDREFYYD